MARMKTSKYNAKALKKKQRKEKLKNQRKKASQKKKTQTKIKYALAAAGAILAIFLIINSSGAEPGDPVMEISPEAINFGDVSVSGGSVSTNFEIKNVGVVVLRINDMETSCGCTSASIIYKDKEGPLFNMRAHGTNPTGWSVDIEPGDTAQLKIIYNPRVHADLRGAVTRIVTLYTNDPKFGVKDVYIKVNQVD
jgi:hypothetical protein